MRIPLARFAVVIATAVCAGCLSGPAPVESPEPAAEPPYAPAQAAEPTEPQQANPTTDNGSEPRIPERAAAEPTPPALARIDVAFEGRTAARLCPHTSQSACLTLKSAVNTSIPLDGVARPVFLRGTLTWDASTPTTSHMIAYVRVDDGKHPVTHQRSLAKAHGESPLEVSFKLPDHRGQKLLLGVANDDCLLDSAPAANCALSGSFIVEPAQEFSFEGELTGWT